MAMEKELMEKMSKRAEPVREEYLDCECCRYHNKTSVLDVVQEYQASVEDKHRACVAAASSSLTWGAAATRSREQALLEFFTSVDASAILSPTPPALLIVGAKESGKSSFVNSVYRLIYNESGALVRRAETGSLAADITRTRHYKFFPVLRSPVSLGMPVFTLIDTPALEKSLQEDELCDLLLNEVAESYDIAKLFPECVILMVSAAKYDKAQAKFDWAGVTGAPRIARFLREEGMPCVVVITHKDLALERDIDVAAMVEALEVECGTDSVNCIVNFPARANSPDAIANDKGILHILEQAMMFARAERASCSEIA